jgi:hypothetical protein
LVAVAVLNENGAEVRWTGKNGEAKTGPPSRGAREIKLMKKTGAKNGNRKSCAEILAVHKPSRVAAEAITPDRTGKAQDNEKLNVLPTGADWRKQAAEKQIT